MFLSICYKYWRLSNEHDLALSLTVSLRSSALVDLGNPPLPLPWMLSMQTCWLKSLRAQFKYHHLHEACCDSSSQKSSFSLLKPLRYLPFWVMDYILPCLTDISECVLPPLSTSKLLERKKKNLLFIFIFFFYWEDSKAQWLTVEVMWSNKPGPKSWFYQLINCMKYSFSSPTVLSKFLILCNCKMGIIVAQRFACKN